MPVSLKQGVITLIPKPNKDKLFIENWRPVSLLNNDSKLFAMIFARRLKQGLDKIIDIEQSGFMQGCHIRNNIRPVLDMVDYNHLIEDESFILFIDFYTAFDTVIHDFIWKVIKLFGFGDMFLRSVKTLYRGCNNTVKLAHGTSQRFDIHHGIRQGCPLSPFYLC